jgi:hypothetical protein
MWELLSLCSYVRNELVHSIDTQKVKQQSDKVREAYLSVRKRAAAAEQPRNDRHADGDEPDHGGSFVVIATEGRSREQGSHGWRGLRSAYPGVRAG